jgi:hypothetical protein
MPDPSTAPAARRVRVTRDVDPAALRDLADRPRWATVTFMEGERADILPARADLASGEPRFGVDPRRGADLDGREVVLIVDDGPYWFELRALSIRGVARRAAGAAGDLAWYALETKRVVAWDYGSLREEDARADG